VTVSFSNISLDHVHNQSPFRQHAFIPRPRNRGSSGLKYIYQKFILTSPLHAILIEIPFQHLRITSRREHLQTYHDPPKPKPPFYMS